MAALPKDEPADEELEELCRIASEVPALWQNEAVKTKSENRFCAI